jgi:hypothetical protein
MALIVLMSSISLSVSFHICGGEIQNVAIFGKAQACTEHNNACDHQENRAHSTLDHKGCCKDASVSIDSDKYSFAQKVIVDGPQFIFLLAANPVQQFIISTLERVHFSTYRPPLIERDITVFVQSFLI